MKSLTPVELELMTILWKRGEGGASVHEVLAALPADRKLAYTSVSTVLRILEQKGVVGSRKVGRGHAYFAVLKKPEYEASTVKTVVAQVFDGAPAALVRQLLDTEGLSERDLAEIRELLDKKAGRGRS